MYKVSRKFLKKLYTMSSITEVGYLISSCFYFLTGACAWQKVSPAHYTLYWGQGLSLGCQMLTEKLVLC